MITRDFGGANRILRASPGERYIATIGIDRYQSWNALNNAVRDARGAGEAFRSLGFKEITTPLLNDAATRGALLQLVHTDLHSLRDDDSLVVFFAGHGHTASLPGDRETQNNIGYLIPVDAKTGDDRRETWILLSSWLTELGSLRARHILVILDSCHSGIAIAPMVRWCGDRQLAMPVDQLQERRSRRVIASALENQTAADGNAGGHSLFTECLIDGLTGAIATRTNSTHITGTTIWSHIQTSFQGFTGVRQVPNYGAFDHHDDGDFAIPLPRPAQPRPDTTGSTTAQTATRGPAPKSTDEPSQPTREVKAPSKTPSVVASSLEDLASARLDLQQSRRKQGTPTLSLLVGESTAVRTYWAKWATRHRRMVLLTDQATPNEIASDLLRQLPWVRCLPAARARFATAAQLSLDALDASFAARSQIERVRWVGNMAGTDRHVRVSGWLLNALAHDTAQIPDLSTAPVQGAELLAILCDLSAPLAILIESQTPSESWLQSMLPIAASLTRSLRGQPIGLCVPTEIADRVIASHGGRESMSMARQGRVDIGNEVPRATLYSAINARRALFDALNRDSRTTNLFALEARVPTDQAQRFTAVDVMGKTVRLAIQIDDATILESPQRYHDERVKDVWLQNAGFYVQRFLAEDVRDQLAAVIDEIVTCVGSRRRARSTWEIFYDQSTR